MATRINFLKKKKLNKPILFTGLPGIGLVGKIAVDYLLKQLKTEKIAEIYSDSFPPSVHTKGALIELIHDDLHVFEFKKQHFLLLAGPVQPALDFRIGSAQEHYEFAEQIVKTMKELKVKQVFTLAGINIGDKRMEKESEIVIAASSKKILEEFEKLGCKVDKKEGLISGAAGLIVGLGELQGIEGACLMGETNANLVYGDHGAAKKLIEILVKKFGFKVDMNGIAKEAQNIEKAFQQLNKQLQELREKEMEEEEGEKPKGGLSYVR